MLVLSRKKNESIIINNDITIVVVEIRGDKVRLGVEAPREIPVHRREVYEAIRRQEAAAATAQAEAAPQEAVEHDAEAKVQAEETATAAAAKGGIPQTGFWRNDPAHKAPASSPEDQQQAADPAVEATQTD